MPIFVNGVDVITPNKTTQDRAANYSIGLRDASSSTVITGGGTDLVYSAIASRVALTTPEGYLDIGSSLVSLPIYMGSTQSTSTQLKIIKKGEMVGLTPRYVITSSISTNTDISSYLSTSDKANVKKAIYVIQAPGGGGAGSGTWGPWTSNRDAGGAGGGAGAFAVYMTNDIFKDTILAPNLNGGAGGALKTKGSDGSNILIRNSGTLALRVHGGGGGSFRDDVDRAASGGERAIIYEFVPASYGKLITSHYGGYGGGSNSVGNSSSYVASTVEGKINLNDYFGMKYGASQDTKAIARFYNSTYSYVTASSKSAGTLYGNNAIGRGGTGAASFFSTGGHSIHKGTNIYGGGYYGSGGGGASSRSSAGDRLAGGAGGQGMVAILF